MLGTWHRNHTCFTRPPRTWVSGHVRCCVVAETERAWAGATAWTGHVPPWCPRTGRRVSWPGTASWRSGARGHVASTRSTAIHVSVASPGHVRSSVWQWAMANRVLIWQRPGQANTTESANSGWSKLILKTRKNIYCFTDINGRLDHGANVVSSPTRYLPWTRVAGASWGVTSRASTLHVAYLPIPTCVLRREIPAPRSILLKGKASLNKIVINPVSDFLWLWSHRKLLKLTNQHSGPQEQTLQTRW